jgi:uncharacterized membrane protein
MSSPDPPSAPPTDPDPQETGDPHGVLCPHCGHELSMFAEPIADRAETVASKVADAVGSWWFLLVLIVASIGWIVVNLVVEPLQPHPSTMLYYLGVALTAVTALYGPLILLAQRRSTARDRARDREALRVATRTEGDLHAILERLQTAVGPPDRS